MGELGLLGIRYDRSTAGQGLDYSYQAIFLEELALCDNAGVAMGISVQTDMATPALHRFGSEELKKRYLVPAIRGEQVAAIARHRARRGLRRRGHQDARRPRRRPLGDQRLEDVHHQRRHRRLALPARGDRSRGAATAAITQIIVPTDTPGFSYQLLDKIGNRGSDTGLLFFDDVRVPIANTIGDPNRGFQQQMTQFQDERMVPVVTSPVSARRLWELTLAHCPAARGLRAAAREDAGESASSSSR